MSTAAVKFFHSFQCFSVRNFIWNGGSLQIGDNVKEFPFRYLVYEGFASSRLLINTLPFMVVGIRFVNIHSMGGNEGIIIPPEYH